ncbi:MAG: lipid II flippase MurJ, partial [Candidatus Omnitrophota bacterium]
ANENDKLKQVLSFGLRSVFFVILPAGVFFMVSGKLLIATLFVGGKFDNYSAMLTTNALFFYSIGLAAYGANKILQSCFFSLKDTVTPAKIAGVSLLLNVVLNSIFMFPLKIGGIALATSISGIVAFFLLWAALKKKIGDFGFKEIAVSFLRILAASVAMGIICHFSSQVSANRALNLAVVLILGFIFYVIFCFIFKVEEMRQLWNLIVYRWGWRKKIAK